MTDIEFIAIQSTCNQREPLLAIANALVESRLAACVQISGPITSVYVWKGKSETSEEWLLAAKTTQELFEPAHRMIASMHPYEVPEVMAIPLLAAAESYGRWIRDQIASPGVPGE